MYDILLSAVNELEKKDEKLADNYQQFKKQFQQYQESAEKFGLNPKVSDEQLFGRPYKLNKD